MTVLQSRPILRVRPAAEEPGRSPMLAGFIAAAWTAGCGLLAALAIAVAAWFAADSGTFGGAVRVGALGWLVAQGSGLQLGATEITAIPLGGCVVAGILLYRAGRWVGSTSRVVRWGEFAGALALFAATYTGIAVAVHLFTRTDAAQADLARVVVFSLVLASGFGGLAMLRASGHLEALHGLLPGRARAVLVGVAAGVVAMVGMSALVLVVAMTVHFSEAVRLAEGMHAGIVGGFILALIGVAAVPNGVLCAGAYVAGPGFLLGTGTAVSPFDVQLGPLPAFPLLAGAPRSSGAWWQEALLLLPVVAGATAGWMTLRRSPGGTILERTGLAAVSGAVAGCVFGVSTWLATGSLGPGRMQDLGPDVFLTTLICTVSLAVGATASGLALSLRPGASAGE